MSANDKPHVERAGDTRATRATPPIPEAVFPFPFDAAMPIAGEAAALSADQAKLAELQKRTFRGHCTGTTAAGTRCERHVVFANGRCKAHGGMNPPEYIAAVLARLKYNAERKLRRAAKRARKAARAGGLRIVGGADDI